MKPCLCLSLQLEMQSFCLGASRHFRCCVVQSPYLTDQVTETQEAKAVILSHSTN